MPGLPYHRPQRGWHPSRAPAPQRSRSIVYEVLSISTRRGRRARVERAAAGSPQPWGCPRRALRSANPRAREPGASWNVSAATASRRRPTTASPRRCRRSTSRRLHAPHPFPPPRDCGRRTTPGRFPSLSLQNRRGDAAPRRKKICSPWYMFKKYHKERRSIIAISDFYDKIVFVPERFAMA